MTSSGWTNYETRNVKLWIDNEEGSLDYWQERAEVSGQDETGLADELKDFFQEMMPPVHGIWADLLQSSLDSVNWREIAENMLEDLEEE